MSESRIWFMLEVLWLLALAGICFGVLGWWWRGKLAITTSLPEDLQEISELKERLLEYELASKLDEPDSKRDAAPTSDPNESAQADLLRQIHELKASLATAMEAGPEAGPEVGQMEALQAELASARDALALAELQKVELKTALDRLKQTLQPAATEAQGVLSLEIPGLTDADPTKKKRAGKRK